MFGLKDINTENRYDETDEKKLKIADTISIFTNPPIITIPLFLIICIILACDGTPFTSGFSFNWTQFIITELISLVFASILPMAIILHWARKLDTDKDISNREDRFVPLIVGVVSYLIGFIIAWILGVSNFLIVLILCYAVNTFIVMLITTKWKISIHTTGLTGPVAALIMLLGPIGALVGLLYPILIWSRFTLKKHTMDELVDSMTNEELAFLSFGKLGTIRHGTGIIGGYYNSGPTGKYNIPFGDTNDGPAGLRQSEVKMGSTAWPCSTALASTFDVELLRKVGEETGNIAVVGHSVSVPAGVKVAAGVQVDQETTF